ncbi:MAG: bifunctional cobalt-precorrin-7 (C(5))-methyltransferase/cobalt-precorrin-6B (C(15))-methyltransferase, partial [Lachnospiraceae bacterium]|nr:bifunctional cobalt-precorrin-7 (C(5))-methyltransferase/cobalt-precorrin-6B (C(15))-methyltransferase [Lachnospiraceae bacterium]
MNSNHTYYASIPDSEFIRGKVPMTKEEIRQISIGKMKLIEDAVVYDVGSGTGSVAVTIAGISDQIQVYAIER